MTLGLKTDILQVEGFKLRDVEEARLHLLSSLTQAISNKIVDATIAYMLEHPTADAEVIRSEYRNGWAKRIYAAMSNVKELSYLLFELTWQPHFTYCNKLYTQCFITSYPIDLDKIVKTRTSKFFVTSVAEKPFIFSKSEASHKIYRQIYAAYWHLLTEYTPDLILVQYIKKES